MEGAGWIGGTPESRPEAYLSRGGRTTVMNLLTPLLMIHGLVDPRVPFEQPTAYLETARAHGKTDLIQTLFFPGVGHPGHYGGLDEAGHRQRVATITAHLTKSRQAPRLPDKGRMVVAGCLVTRRFTVMLESADHVALLDYDLGRSQFALRAPSSRTAKFRLAGETEWRMLPCARLSLADLKQQLKVKTIY
jgi:hypothetical protein